MVDDADRSRDEFTTMRVYKPDGKMLAEIAELCGLTAAEAFRDVCGQLLREKLVAVTERRLIELKAGA